MKYPILTIAADGSTPSRRNRHRPQKSRSFQCTLLRCLSWPAFKQGTGKSYNAALRPIFLDYCGTESEHRAFTANLRCGRAASIGDGNNPTTIELLKSEPYLYAPPVKCEAGVRQIVYLPELFDLETKAQRDDVWLCVMPPTSLLSTVTMEELACARAALRLTNDRIAAEVERAEQHNVAVVANNERYYSLSYEQRRLQNVDYQSTVRVPEPVDLDDEAVRYWALIARELCVRLDARTRYPIPYAPEFRTLLVQHFVAMGMAKRADGNPLQPLTMGQSREDSYRMPLRIDGPQVDYRIWQRRRDRDDVGYAAPLALSISQAELGESLSKLAQLYYARERCK